MNKKLLIVNIVALVAAVLMIVGLVIPTGEEGVMLVMYLPVFGLLLSLGAPAYLYLIFAIVWGIIAIVKSVKNIIKASKGEAIAAEYANSKRGNFWSVFVLVLAVLGSYYLLAMTAGFVAPIIALACSITLLVTLKISQKTLKAMVVTEEVVVEATEEVAAAE